MNILAFRQLGVDRLAVFQSPISYYPDFSNSVFTRICLGGYEIIIIKKNWVLFTITKIRIGFVVIHMAMHWFQYVIASDVLMSLCICSIGVWGFFCLFVSGFGVVFVVFGWFFFFCPTTRSTLPNHQLVADVLVSAWSFSSLDLANLCSNSNNGL